MISMIYIWETWSSSWGVLREKCEEGFVGGVLMWGGWRVVGVVFGGGCLGGWARVALILGDEGEVIAFIETWRCAACIAFVM